MEKIYVGKGVKKSETWIKATINPEKLTDYIKEYEGHKFVKLNINILNQPNKYGKDVEITVDTWEPNQQKTTQQQIPQTQASQEKVIDIDEIPFN